MTAAPSRPTGSHFANAEAARTAVEMALPMIEPAMRMERVCGSGFLHLVVMDPAIGPEHATFEEAVLFEHSIGDRSRWDADYGAFARAKARLSWLHRADSHRLQAERPHLLREGDSLLWGGVHLDGITVGVSGAEAWWDEAFALAVAGNLRALAKHRHAAARQQNQLYARASNG